MGLKDIDLRREYDKARRLKFKANNPNWREIERERRSRPEVKSATRLSRLKNIERERQWKREWYRANREKVLEYDRQWRAANQTQEYRTMKHREWVERSLATDPDAHRRKSHAQRIRVQFNITGEQYEALLAAQDGVCALCGRPETRTVNGVICRLSVDHDHTCCPGKRSCGKCIRGLLCRTCNGFMGWAKDSPTYLRAAADYIERHAEKVAA